MAQLEPLREQPLRVAPCSHLVDSHDHFPLGAAQLVCSQIECLPEFLTYFLRDLVPTSVGDPDPHVFGLQDPDPLVRGTDPAQDSDPSISHECAEQTEIMPAK